ncbi:uncharacterized protein LOC128554386 [Mercenaria mercenaria]|uniref:uncharacterized protein LOC128554386 n=1 Tax=Mercenaria mercenaria TaxID=6596 RepID=UPI00234E738D|nr:uncharacterized protein LOC128554386 [Mercenaria mercenaria]
MKFCLVTKKYKYRSNLSKEEQEALKQLSQDETIVVKKADKGSSVVIMNRKDYISEAYRQLENNKYYKRLDENPQKLFNKDIHDSLNNLENIRESTLENLYPSNADRVPQFYILPKIHKTFDPDLPLGYPGRPIISGCGDLTENMSAYVDTIFKPYMESLPSYVKDTTYFIKKLQNLSSIDKDAYLVTLDVTSLYSNIPHGEGIDACKYFMENGSRPQDSINSISKIIELILTKNDFQFNEINYIQTFGTAMGTKMPHCFASLFMGKLEKEFIDSCDKKPLIWLRFLDIFFIWNHSEEDLLDFFDRLNSFHDTIKFTYCYSKDTATFLDVNIEKDENGILHTSVHEKDANNHQYIEFSSCHPVPCKKGIPFSQAKRFRRITSDNTIFDKEMDKLREYFQARNYPECVINEALKKASSLSMQDALNSCSNRNTDKVIPFVCTYNPSLPNIGKIINQYWNLLKYSQQESVRQLYDYKPIVAYKRPKNIQDV